MNVIAIDGPSAAGKGTLGPLLAQKYNFFYIDSGLLYRQFAYCLLTNHISLEDLSALIKTLEDHKEKFQLTMEDTEHLRLPAISAYTSQIATIPAVRMLANQVQRTFVKKHKNQWFVIDGRDIGTVVFPDAQIKFFVTADPKVRAQRRFNQLQEKSISTSLESVERDMLARDKRDQERQVDPLKPAADSILIDTSHHSIPEVLKNMVNYVEKSCIMC